MGVCWSVDSGARDGVDNGLCKSKSKIYLLFRWTIAEKQIFKLVSGPPKTANISDGPIVDFQEGHN